PATQQERAHPAQRHTAAGARMAQTRTPEQAKLVKETALEGLYYVRAARVAMGMDPGPQPPEEAERQRAGKVTEHRKVDVEGQSYEASPDPGSGTPYYYPGGRVAGRPVPQGWYSEPWWKPALVAGAWGLGSMLLFSTMFDGMSGIAGAQAWESGFDAGQADAMADMGGADAAGDLGGDPGGFDGGGGGFD